MASGVNGYVTINVGVINGHGKPVAASSGKVSEDERNRRVRRLRKEGWSYRRIAATLGMSYAAVCHLLDGDEARLPAAAVTPLPLPPRRAVAVPAANAPRPDVAVPRAAAPAPPALEEMVAQIQALQQRVDMLLAVNDGLRQSLARLERTMVATLHSEHRALGDRLQVAFRGLLERMLPTGFRRGGG